MKIINHNFLLIFHVSQRPPSSSLSYGGAVNDDVRSPGSGGTPGPLSAQPPPGLDSSDPGKSQFAIHYTITDRHQIKMIPSACGIGRN